MFVEWGKFAGWRVLEFFLEKNKRMHLNGLARELKISPRTAQVYLRAYFKEGLLEKERIANSDFYRLKETPLALELRKALMLSKIQPCLEKFLGQNPNVSVLAVYGSIAKGTFDENSDIDLIAISQLKQLKIEMLKKIEQKTGMGAKLQVFSIAEWKQMLESKDYFAVSVLKNKIAVKGEL